MRDPWSGLEIVHFVVKEKENCNYLPRTVPLSSYEFQNLSDSVGEIRLDESDFIEESLKPVKDSSNIRKSRKIYEFYVRI